jgi:CRISPR system Cascade subunit CasB
MNDIKRLLDEIRQAAVHEDRGKLAALRRGFSEATEQYAWPYLAPYCDITKPGQRLVWLTVAGAAATLVPDGLARSGAGNIGATMRRLALGDDHPKDAQKVLASFEARFRRLLACQTTGELCQHLVGVIRAASAKKKPVDVGQLFWDLKDWEDRASRDVRVEWARGYWEPEPRAHETEETPCAT